MNKLKVKLINQASSSGRGVGFYAQHLTTALEKNKQVELVSDKPDVIHYTYFDLFYPTLPLSRRIPTVITIHDVAPLVLPHLYPKGIRGSLNLWRQWLSLSSTKAVITDSLSAKKDINKHLKVPNKKIYSIPLAVEKVYHEPPSAAFIKQVKQKYALPDQFILYVGGVNPNKNLNRLMQAASDLVVPLVLVGSEFTKKPLHTFSFKSLIGLQSIHPELRQFKKLTQEIDDNPQIITPGFVPSKELNAIYRLATVYCQPSLYEGFGLPLLEAMTAGCLVTASRVSSLPEIYPKGTITFDPKSVRSIKIALNKALSLKKPAAASKIKAALTKSENFSWEKVADMTTKIYLKATRKK